jgi:predicted PurR-regulated permease PerM
VSAVNETKQVVALARWLLIGFIVVLAWFAVTYLAGVLAPILTALGIAYLLNPVLERLVKLGINRALGAAILLGGFVAIVVTVITVFAPRIADQVATFVHDLPRLLDNLSAWSKEHLGVELP